MTSEYTIWKQTLVGLCAALVIIFSQISIPIPFSVVPITFQTFAVVLIAIVLEEPLATHTMLVYTLLGCVGLPVFSNFSGGLTRIMGPTGGFILGFIIMAFMIGKASKMNQKHILWVVTYIGLMVDYLLGVMHLAFVTQMSIKDAVVAGMLPFILKDLVLVGAAVIVASRIKSIVRKSAIRFS